MLEGPEIPTCVGLPSRKYLPVSVQVERRLAKAVSYVTRQMATGAPAWAPADAISSATWQTNTGAPAQAPASQCHLIRHVADGYWRARSGAGQPMPSHPPRGRRIGRQPANGRLICHVADGYWHARLPCVSYTLFLASRDGDPR